MAVGFSNINKPINPRGQDASPLAYNRAKLYSGKALDFDGVNDLVTMPTALTSSLSTTSVTFVTNVKTDFATWAGTRDDAFSFAERGMILAFNGGNIYYYYRHQSSGWRNLQVPNADFKPQEWNQMVTTIDLNTNTWKAYVNGVEVATSGTYSDTAIAYDANALTIGGQAGARFFDGQLSGFKIFNTALTAAQVADLYNNPEKVVPTGVDNTALKLWLPMMEGAGTTAYDGSGNGNHGTISGATYVNGVGAPVSQSAVMDWNKGTNLTPNSEDFGLWILNFVSVTTNATTAPDGQSTADKIIVDSNNNFHRIYRQSYSNTTTNDLAFSVYLKYNDHQHVSFGLTDDSKYRVQIVVDLISGVVTDEHTDSANVVSSSLTNVGNGWYKLEGVITPTTAWGNNIYTMLMFQNSSTFSAGTFTNAGASVYAWGAQSQFASTNGAYILTFNASQDIPVLLPQGLTSGRDITGVNLFENVRKQGALNLDGNSWAEVHDNASLDITPAMTMEVWIKCGDELNSDYDHVFVKPTSASWSSPYGTYVLRLNNSGIQWWFDSVSNATGHSVVLTGWNHLAVTKNGTAEILYVNGTQVDTHTGAATISLTAFDLIIGTLTSKASSESVANQLAQPRIYNRALTAEEVQRSYDSGKNIFTNS